jgi:sulfatase maturation enzyme AslB (radical SAM superfamily)
VAVFHGGGEPTLAIDLLQSALELIQGIARDGEVSLFRYIATNGVFDSGLAAWIAAHFDMVGLSCDGPPDIQNRQRPLRIGEGTASTVETTARVFRDTETPFRVRVTITPETVDRQEEIAAYICDELQPQSIHFEPVYAGADGVRPWAGEDAVEAFIEHYQMAKVLTHSCGKVLTTSISRPEEIHATYCHIHRQVLNIVPGDTASICFKDGDYDQAAQNGTTVGRYNRATDTFEIDEPRIAELRKRISTPPERCRSCFNQYHCVWGCPDHCRLQSDDEEPGFRCRAARALTVSRIVQAADAIWQAGGLDGGIGGTTEF